MSFPALCSHDFAFSPEANDSPGEHIEDYRPGGFHPVTLGMIICSPSARYRVIQKLGFGGYSTVWLVDILNKPGCAALRISKAGAVFEGEDDVLRRITTLPTTSHIAAILDDFTIDGPNGTHQVTVMEVLAPMMVAVYFLSQSAPSPSVPHTMRSHSTADVVDSPPPALHVFSASIYKTVVRSLVQAVAEVHAAGIVHGDLHLGNVGLALPTLADGSDTERIWSYPDVTIVFPRDPELAAFSSHFPPYIVQPWSFHSFLQAIGGAKIAPVVKIYDFGTSYCLERPHPTTGFLNQIVAPEWVIQGSGPDVMRTPDSACDIWALGVMIFCLMAGGVYPYTAYNSTAHFITMARLSGRIPRSWMVYEWANDPKLYEELSEEKCAQQWAEYRTLLRPRCESDADADGLVTLLRRMFSLDPSERPSAADILQDRWFLPPGTSEVNFTDTQYV